MRSLLTPELFHALSGYNRRQFLTDIASGAVVGVVALPLAIAFAIASGVTPDRGLYTAIVAGFLISLLGGSRVQIGGPTGAFIVIVYGIVQQHGVDGLLVATMMAGVFLIILGIGRLGTAIKFIPFPVTTGFTAGIALLILSSQVRDFLGLQMGDVPADFVGKWRAYAGSIHTVNWSAAAIAVATVAIIMLWPRISRRVPGTLVAIVLTTAVVHVSGLEVETIGGRFGPIDATIRAPEIPALSLELISALVAPAFTIALLAAIESLLSAVVADGMIGSRHRSNTELVAQGVANVVAPLFGGIPATGAIARTATNVQNGGRTPVAGLAHAVTLLVLTVGLGRWAALIPMATLAGLLTTVAWHMSGWRTFISELRAPRSDVAVLLLTFTLTVAVDLTVAIEVGMVAAAFLFMRKMAEVTDISAVEPEFDEADSDADQDAVLQPRSTPPGVRVYEVNGPFFFGAAEKFKDTLSRVASAPKVLILRMRHVPAIDSTGMNALGDVIRRSRKDGTLVLLTELQPRTLGTIMRSSLAGSIPEGDITSTYESAILRAREHIAVG